MRRRLLFLSAILAVGLSGGAAVALGTRPSLPEVDPQADGDLGPTSSSSSAESGLQPSGPGIPRLVPGSQALPPGHPPIADTPRTHAPGLVQQRELRRRIAEAVELGQRARSGDAAATAEVAAQLVTATDPRIRQALATGQPPPHLGQLRGWTPPVLPEPTAAAVPGEVRAYWLTPGQRDGTYESTVTVDPTGQAMVETVHESDDGERWHVRYPAWAYRDGQGRLVVDARGQPVECLQKPEWGWWSPDSMVIGADGLIDMIDDKHDPGQGTSGADGPG